MLGDSPGSASASNSMEQVQSQASQLPTPGQQSVLNSADNRFSPMLRGRDDQLENSTNRETIQQIGQYGVGAVPHSSSMQLNPSSSNSTYPTPSNGFVTATQNSRPLPPVSSSQSNTYFNPQVSHLMRQSPAYPGPQNMSSPGSFHNYQPYNANVSSHSQFNNQQSHQQRMNNLTVNGYHNPAQSNHPSAPVVHEYSHIMQAMESHSSVPTSTAGHPGLNTSYGPQHQNGGQQIPYNSLPHQQPEDKLSRLMAELEQERKTKLILQQRLVDAQQKLHAQNFLENSYQDLAMKYKSVIDQAQEMVLVIERYKTLLSHLEQEKRMLVKENESLEVRANAAQNKIMKYNSLMERSKKLEEENTSLILENEQHHRQYEKCVDEISQQVVQALMTQKALQSQCMQLQERVVELEKEKSEYQDSKQNRQVSSDSRLGGANPRHARSRGMNASPSADSVRSMPAQHNYWKKTSFSSLDTQQLTNGIPEVSSPAAGEGQSSQKSICIETEFPASNESPRVKRRSVDRHPSGGSLDLVHHGQTTSRFERPEVRCVRSLSAEALRDMRIHPVGSGLTARQKEPHKSMPSVHQAKVQADALNASSPEDEGPPREALNDPFADSFDDILSKHQSLIVGSQEDIFSHFNGEDNPYRTIQEESESPAPARVRDGLDDSDDEPLSPPPLPPKQYKGSRRPYKPLPAEPPDSGSDTEGRDDSGSLNTYTDTESIKQEISKITNKISGMSS